MVDSGVFLRFLGASAEDPDTPMCKAFCEAMLERGHVLYVAAPSLAEIVRETDARPPRVKGIVVVPFDDRAAEVLGARMHAPRPSAPRYAALVMACAARSKTTTLVTLAAEDHLPLAAGLEIEVRRPRDFAIDQLDLPGILPPPPPDPPPPEIAEAAPVAEPELEPEPDPEPPPPPPTRQLALPW